MTKDQAIKILEELKNSPNMVKHAQACGFAMSALFDYFSQNNKNTELDKNSWEIVGLLHDADYEITDKSLELHTKETTKKLKEVGAQKEIIDAVRGHADKEPRETLIAKSIYACDELTGLIVASALVQPDPPAGEAGKKLKSVTVESVLKKYKDKAFARGANRDQIKTCEDELKIALEEFIAIVLKSMQDNSDELGL